MENPHLYSSKLLMKQKSICLMFLLTNKLLYYCGNRTSDKIEPRYKQVAFTHKTKTFVG